MQQRTPEAFDADRAAVAADPSNPDRMLDDNRVRMGASTLRRGGNAPRLRKRRRFPERVENGYPSIARRRAEVVKWQTH